MERLSRISAALDRLADPNGYVTLQRLIELMQTVIEDSDGAAAGTIKAMCESIRIKPADYLGWLFQGHSMTCAKLEEKPGSSQVPVSTDINEAAEKKVDEEPRVPEAPPGMAKPHEVTEEMKHRQTRDPEQWTMTLQQFIDVLEWCKCSPTYQAIKKAKGFVNMYDISKEFVIPWTQGTGCSLAVLMSQHEKAEAQLMYSHAWGEDVEETLQAVRQFAENYQIPTSVPVWFCVFSNYQAGDEFGPTIQFAVGWRVGWHTRL